MTAALTPACFSWMSASVEVSKLAFGTADLVMMITSLKPAFAILATSSF